MEIDLKNKKPDIRYLDDMREVLFDKEWSEDAPDVELYYMYRGVKEPRTKAFGLVRGKENELRHNITVIPARMLGKEFSKTKGHIHIGSYGEVYTVLEGEAIFLMQKTRDNVVEDVFAVKAGEGESVVIPSYYGHVTINPAGKDLKTGDWSSQNCKSDYSLFEKLEGACYYYILRPNSGQAGLPAQAGWVKNPNYKNIPNLRFEKPLKSLPEDLSFLKEG